MLYKPSLSTITQLSKMALEFTVGIYFVIIYLSIPLVMLFLQWFNQRNDSKRLNQRERAIVLVLGDLGRSPRMLYHARSLAKGGLDVDLCGYDGECLTNALNRCFIIIIISNMPNRGKPNSSRSSKLAPSLHPQDTRDSKYQKQAVCHFCNRKGHTPTLLPIQTAVEASRRRLSARPESPLNSDIGRIQDICLVPVPTH